MLTGTIDSERQSCVATPVTRVYETGVDLACWRVRQLSEHWPEFGSFTAPTIVGHNVLSWNDKNSIKRQKLISCRNLFQCSVFFNSWIHTAKMRLLAFVAFLVAAVLSPAFAKDPADCEVCGRCMQIQTRVICKCGIKLLPDRWDCHCASK